MKDENCEPSPLGLPKRPVLHRSEVLEELLKQITPEQQAETTIQMLKEIVSEQSQRITNLIEVKDKLYYRCEALEEALREVLNLIDSGVLVRDISKDHEPGWAIKQLPLIQTLAKAKSLLSKFNDEKS